MPHNLTLVPRSIVASIAAALAIGLSGCASRPQPSGANVAVDLETAATLNIYRPDEGAVAAALNFYAYVDGTRVGRVNSEESATAKLTPGKHQLLIQSEMLGIPSSTQTTLTVDMAPKSVHYVRFSVRVGDIRVIGTAVSATSTRELRLVDQDAWLARR